MTRLRRIYVCYTGAATSSVTLLGAVASTRVTRTGIAL